MTAILLIPFLVKAAKLQRGESLPEGVQKPTSHVLRHVCGMMMHDIYVDEDEDGIQDDEPELNVALIQQILRAYGEDDLAQDEALCVDMLAQMNGHSKFNADSLAQALTADVQLYNIENETKYSTLYQDIFGTAGRVENNTGKTLESNGDAVEKEEVVREAPTLKHTYTAPAIDSVAATYRSRTLLVCMWSGTLFAYFANPYGVDTEGFCDPYVSTLSIVSSHVCIILFSCVFRFLHERYQQEIGGNWAENWDTMGCETTNAVVFWLYIFVSLCLFGMVWIGCGTCGNAQHNVPCWKPSCGGLFLMCVVILPFIGDNYEKDFTPDQQYVRVVALIFACTVIFMHILHCVEICAADDKPRKEKLRKHAYQSEVDLKSSIQYKVNRMVENAVEIHHSSDTQNIVKTCFGRALHVYSKWNKTKKVGGLVWAWKNIYNGTFFTQEGIWYSARLTAANLSQYIVVLYIILAGIYYVRYIGDNFANDAASEALSKEVERVIWSRVDIEAVEAYSVEIGSYFGTYLNDLNGAGTLNVDCSGFASTSSQVLSESCGGLFLGCDYNDTTVQTETLCALLATPGLDPAAQLTLLQGSGLSTELIIRQIEAAMQQGIDDSVDSLYPNERFMLTFPLTITVIVAVLTSLFLAVNYLPSITSTTLQLRSGVIPTLTEKKLNQYRAAVSIHSPIRLRCGV
eukprot:scaffold6378_cov176-Amphora_coffeaeformis.AAC.12